MPLLEPRFVSLAAVLSEPRQPPFRALVGIGRGIVDCFAALHAAGLCYRDVNFGNLRVDPAAAEVRIIDCDNVGVDGDRAFVKGSLRFMAPEIVRGEALPSSTTDFFSLAVLLFHLLVHGHPLDGSRADESWDWTSGLDEYGIAVRNLGEEPLFVFDPADASNRPREGDPMLTWWPIYPRFLRELFEQAFTGGMRDPSSPDRFTEGRWRRALGRLADSLTVCPSCRAANVWDADDLAKACWNCGAVPPPPWLLHVPGHDVVLTDGATVSAAHLRDARDRDAVLAAVERHPQRADEIVLRNLGDRVWSVRPEGEDDAKEVAPGQRLRVRAMAIDFGTVSGWIAHAGARLAGSPEL
jgi:DNA-binding helix-hairpin-helix protein with protein kinase domain